MTSLALTGLSAFCQGAERIGRVGAVVMAFGMPTSMTITSLGAVMMLVGWLASLSFQDTLSYTRDSHVARGIGLMIIIATVGWFYADAEVRHTVRAYTSYAKYGLVVIMAYLLRDDLWLKRTFAAFVLGVIFTMACTILALWSPVPWAASQASGWGNDLSVVSNYIVQSLTFVGFIWYAVGVIADSASERNKRAVYLLLALGALFSVVFLLRGRTGLMAILLSAVVITLVFAPKYKILFGLSVLGALVGMVAWSPTLWPSLQQGWGQLLHFEGLQTATNSWGARLSMYLLSWDLISQAPLFGHGLGDYRTLSLAFYEDKAMQGISAVHPHNQFLFAWVELGLAGILVWCYLLWGIFRDSKSSSLAQQIFAMGVLLTLTADSLFHAPVWMGNERNIFIVLLGLSTAASLNSQQKSRSRYGG